VRDEETSNDDNDNANPTEYPIYLDVSKKYIETNTTTSYYGCNPH
jgi:hypothetical protein